MLENLNIILLSVTFKTTALCLRLWSRGSILCLTDLGYIWCRFSSLQLKNTSIFQADNSQDNRARSWTGSNERQTTGKPKTLKHALKVATKPLNILNPYQKQLKAKISYYSSGDINVYHHYYSISISQFKERQCKSNKNAKTHGEQKRKNWLVSLSNH